jgi:hypothetical protein
MRSPQFRPTPRASSYLCVVPHIAVDASVLESAARSRGPETLSRSASGIACFGSPRVVAPFMDLSQRVAF